jgi:hypothetical protein
MDEILIRLHERRMEMAEDRVGQVERDIKKIPWIIFITTLNVVLTVFMLVLYI